MGGGGHSREILERGGGVVGLDQDPDAIKKASEVLKTYIDNNKFEIIQSNFRNIEEIVKKSKLLDGRLADGILMDLGISSYQIDEPTRGFAFGSDGPLDMRMSPNTTKLTAATIVNDWDATRIADVLYNYGSYFITTID
jgi:16S rRNA (cytosine1402-N4)-methyltransferase